MTEFEKLKKQYEDEKLKKIQVGAAVWKNIPKTFCISFWCTFVPL